MQNRSHGHPEKSGGEIRAVGNAEHPQGDNLHERRRPNPKNRRNKHRRDVQTQRTPRPEETLQQRHPQDLGNVWNRGGNESHRERSSRCVQSVRDHRRPETFAPDCGLHDLQRDFLTDESNRDG